MDQVTAIVIYINHNNLFILNVEKVPVKALIEKFENQMQVDVDPHGSHDTPTETEKGKFLYKFWISNVMF